MTIATAGSGLHLLIDGRLVDGADRLEVIDPATGAVFATCPRADAAQFEQAIAAAAHAFPAWSALGIDGRRPVLMRFADALEARADEISALLTREQGKPLKQARQEVGGAFACLRYYLGADLPMQILRDTDRDRIVEYRVPLGVVATITPWNFPVSLLLYKLAPALVAGNTVIAKPAPTTPLTTLLIGEIASTILPPGVFNTLVDANDLGPLLTAHPAIAKIAFTGSTATGRRVMASAAGTLKRLTLELGGNDAAIVLDDVDVATVARKVFDAAMVNAGQVCFAAKRIYVPQRMHDAFCAELVRIAEAAIVGKGADETVEIGPLQNRAQFEKVIAFIARARREGRVLTGGHAIAGTGYFIAPTIVADLADDAELVREEQFGPVVPVLGYDDVDDVIARANASEFGLGGTIWTGDVARGETLAMRLETGTVWVNKHLELPADIAFGGTKQSGLGREKGMAGLLEMTQPKVVNSAKQALHA